MIRFLKEFFKPSLKCARLGHLHETKEIKGLIDPSYPERSWYVALKGKKVVEFCPRCGHIHSEELVPTGGGYQSTSWPKSMADEFKEKGFIAD